MKDIDDFPNCPMCGFELNGNHTNIKICDDCALRLEFQGDPEVELIANYSKN